jgi:hypothetical protein
MAGDFLNSDEVEAGLVQGDLDLGADPARLQLLVPPVLTVVGADSIPLGLGDFVNARLIAGSVWVETGDSCSLVELNGERAMGHSPGAVARRLDLDQPIREWFPGGGIGVDETVDTALR